MSELFNTVFDYRIETRSRIILSAPSSSGKTWFILDLIDKKDKVFSESIDKVVYIHSIDQPIFHTFAVTHPDVIFANEPPTLPSDSSTSTLLVFDDYMLIQEKGKDKHSIEDYFVRLSHHLNITIIVTWQALFPPGSKLLSVNASYLIIFPSRRDTSSIDILNRQMMPEYPTFLRGIMSDLRKTKYSYLLIDNTPRQSEPLRFRNFIYPRLDSKVYVPK